MKTRWIRILVMAVMVQAAGLAVARAQESAEPAPAAPAAKKMTLWDLIKTGGWAMWPLGLCSVGLITMVVLNFRQVSARKMLPEAALV